MALLPDSTTPYTAESSKGSSTTSIASAAHTAVHSSTKSGACQPSASERAHCQTLMMLAGEAQWPQCLVRSKKKGSNHCLSRNCHG